jgi:hypothetical protein
MFGKYKREAPTNLQRSSYVAQNATTHSENTVEISPEVQTNSLLFVSFDKPDETKALYEISLVKV